jgi:putative oxidoreductase
MNTFFSRYKNYSPLFLRFVIACYLYIALKVKVYLPEVTAAFGESLDKVGLPFPHFMAVAGTWMALISYVLIVIGWFTRYAAVGIILYFIIALIWGHILQQHTLARSMPAIILLMLGFYFLFNGPGKLSVDEGI